MVKLELAAILVAIVGGALWIEHDHRVVIDAPAAGTESAAVAACPDNDTVPYDSRCLAYLNVPTQPAPRARLVVVGRGEVPAEPCPDNDKVPYSPSCIAFMKGATEIGMNWRVTEQPASIPAPQ